MSLEGGGLLQQHCNIFGPGPKGSTGNGSRKNLENGVEVRRPPRNFMILLMDNGCSCRLARILGAFLVLSPTSVASKLQLRLSVHRCPLVVFREVLPASSCKDTARTGGR